MLLAESSLSSASTNQSITKLVARGKERGYITYDEFNAALLAFLCDL